MSRLLASSMLLCGACKIQHSVFELPGGGGQSRRICCLKIWNSREALREVDSLKSYLFSMAHNAVLNFIKRKGVRDRYQKATVGVGADGEPSFQMDTFELLKSIDEALEDMLLPKETILGG